MVYTKGCHSLVNSCLLHISIKIKVVSLQGWFPHPNLLLTVSFFSSWVLLIFSHLFFYWILQVKWRKQEWIRCWTTNTFEITRNKTWALFSRNLFLKRTLSYLKSPHAWPVPSCLISVLVHCILLSIFLTLAPCLFWFPFSLF